MEKNGSPESNVHPSFGNGVASPFRVGELFRAARVSRGLKVVQLVRQAGLRDNARTLRRIQELERTGVAPLNLVEALSRFFGIPLEDVRQAWRADEETRKRLQWESTGGRPYLVVRFMPSVYRQSPAPDGLDRKGLIVWARNILKERWGGRLKGCLVLSPDEIAWFEESGGFEITRHVPPPSMSIRGKRFLLKA